MALFIVPEDRRYSKSASRFRAMQGQLAPGFAVITGGGNMKARHVIHTVGPVWRDGTRQ